MNIRRFIALPAALAVSWAITATPVSAHTVSWDEYSYTTPITACSPVTTWKGGHADPNQYWAIDVGLVDWTPIYSTKAGYAWYEWNTGGGNMIKIMHAETGGSLTTVLAHLSAYDSARVGSSYAYRKYVAKNVVIGWSGHSGQVTGPHLHWAMSVSDHMTDGRYGANLDLIPGVSQYQVCG